MFFKKKLKIYAPVNGKIIHLEDVPDPIFSQKMMGEGVAIEPTDGKIHAPIDGTIMQVSPTNHAVGIVAQDGTEILVHVGLETVLLEGKGFELKVKEGDKVSKGDLLIETDLEYVRQHADSIITPIVITNSATSDKEYKITNDKTSLMGQTTIITVQ